MKDKSLAHAINISGLTRDQKVVLVQNIAACLTGHRKNTLRKECGFGDMLWDNGKLVPIPYGKRA